MMLRKIYFDSHMVDQYRIQEILKYNNEYVLYSYIIYIYNVVHVKLIILRWLMLMRLVFNLKIR
jgi:hypothetical protein